MPALQTLVLTDRAATPVAHTFLPRDAAGGVGTVVETSGVPVGEKRLFISMRRAGAKLKGRIVLALPVVQDETISGVVRPKVVREAIVDAVFTFSVESTEQERKDLVGMFMSSLDPSKVLVNDSLVKAQGVWGS